MEWTRWDFDLAEVLGGVAIALILTGLLLRNLIDATTSVEAVQAFGGTTILVLLFGYRFASFRLDHQASGLLLLVVGGLVAGLMVLLVPSAFSDRGVLASFGALAVLATAFIVSPWISLPTRLSGILLLFTALLMVSLERTVFDGENIGSAIIVAVLGIVLILWPTAIEGVDEQTK